MPRLSLLLVSIVILCTLNVRIVSAADSYPITFGQEGLDSDCTQWVLNVDGVRYFRDDLPKTFLWEAGYYSYQYNISPGTKYTFNGVTGLSTSYQNENLVISGPGSLTAHYSGGSQTQAQIIFSVKGVDPNFTGNILVVDDVPQILPVTFSWSVGTQHTYSYQHELDLTDKRYILESIEGLSTEESDTITVSSPGNIEASYFTEYMVYFDQSGSKIEPTVTCSLNIGDPQPTPFDYWVREGTQLTYSYKEVVDGEGGVRYRLIGVVPSSPQIIQEPLYVHGDYTEENLVKTVEITFSQQGVNLEPDGSSLIVDGETVNELPATFIWEEGTTHSYEYKSTLSSGDTRFVWSSGSGLSSLQSDTFSASASGSINAVYKTEYRLSFSQLGSSIQPTVALDVKGVGSLTTPFEVWVDENSQVGFTFQKMISDASGVRYVLLNVNPNSPVTINHPASITGTYKTEYLLTVNSDQGVTQGAGWYVKGTTAQARVTPSSITSSPGTRYLFTGWGEDASGTTSTSKPIIMNGPKTAKANWKTQYLVTISTNPQTGISAPIRNPAGEQGPANSWWYDASTRLTLTAQQVDGYVFNNWNIPVTSKTTNSLSLVLGVASPTLAVAVYSFETTNQIHDIAVTDVKSSKTIVGKGYDSNINVAVNNKGNYPETFSVSVYADLRMIAKTQVTLPVGASKQIVFNWATARWSTGKYAVSAVAETVSGEKNTEDNKFVGGKVLVSTPGDLNGDLRVNFRDFTLLINDYIHARRHMDWNPNSDIDNDGQITMSDLRILMDNMNFK